MSDLGWLVRLLVLLALMLWLCQPVFEWSASFDAMVEGQ